MFLSRSETQTTIIVGEQQKSQQDINQIKTLDSHLIAFQHFLCIFQQLKMQLSNKWVAISS